MIDLDDTSHCEPSPECSCCGRHTDEPTVCTAGTTLGVMCFTACPTCTQEHAVPRLGWTDAAAAVGQHCGHLGIDLDEMADELRHEG